MVIEGAVLQTKIALYFAVIDTRISYNVAHDQGSYFMIIHVFLVQPGI